MSATAMDRELAAVVAVTATSSTVPAPDRHGDRCKDRVNQDESGPDHELATGSRQPSENRATTHHLGGESRVDGRA